MKISVHPGFDCDHLRLVSCHWRPVTANGANLLTEISTLYSIEVCLCETASAAKTVGPREVRGVPVHLYCIEFGQCTQPMGSGRPPWAAGEYVINKA